jgi:hypothetical protein
VNFADPLDLVAAAAALCVAAGLSLYATLGALGALATAGLVEMPLRLAGLQSPLVWGPLLAFFAAEAALARTPGPDLLSDSAHTGIRPLGAALLAGTALDFGPDVQWTAAALGAGLALWIHTARAGIALHLRTAPQRRRRLAGPFATAAETTALLLVGLAATRPRAAALAAAVLALAPVPWIAPLRDAGRARRLATWAVLAYPFHGRTWREAHRLPRNFAAALETRLPPGHRTLRSAPAIARQVPGVPTFRTGWLAFTSAGLFFVWQGFRKIQTLPLRAAEIASQEGRILDRLVLRGHGTAEFLLPKSAPRPDALERYFHEALR